jgi:hypothetical protein
MKLRPTKFWNRNFLETREVKKSCLINAYYSRESNFFPFPMDSTVMLLNIMHRSVMPLNLAEPSNQDDANSARWFVPKFKSLF